MTAQAIEQQQHATTLQQLVRRWDRRLRVQQFVRWLALSIVPGLLLGMSLAVMSRLQPLMLPRQIVMWTAIGTGSGFAIMTLAVLFYPRSMTRAAQQFDVLFHLQERVSTALELLNGKIRANAELTTLQLDDAVQRAKAIRANEYLPIQVRWRDWALVAVLIAVLAALLMLPNPMNDVVSAGVEEDESIAEAVEDLRETTEAVAADTTLTEEERDNLLQELDRAIETLEQDDITQEEAFATLSDVETTLQNQANALADRIAAQNRAMASAGAALNGALPSGDETNTADGSQSLEELLQELNNALENATPEQQQDMAEALRDAAQQLQEMNPDAANAMNNAAQQLEQGNTASAQQELNDAQQSLENTPQSQQNLQQSQQNLQQGANSANQAQQNLQQGQQPQQGNTPPNGQPPQGNTSQQQSQVTLGTPSPGQAAQMGTPTFNMSQTDGDTSGENAGQTDSGQSASSGGESGSDPSMSSSSTSQGSATASTASGMGNTGAGDNDGPKLDNGFQAGNDPISTDNNPDGEGVTQFDSVYAPQRVGGDGGPTLSLESEDSESPLIEGEFSENPTGNVTVPYNQVFSDYSNAANQALESEYIPLGMQDIVRDYFTSIEPGQ